MTGDRKQVTSPREKTGYKRLLAWELADKLALEVYKLTSKFPKEEMFGVTSQLRRAVLSVVLNIVEGHSRNSQNEFRQFLKIALGSLAEVDYLLYFAYTQKFLKESDYQKLDLMRVSCGKVLWKLMKSL